LACLRESSRPHGAIVPEKAKPGGEVENEREIPFDEEQGRRNSGKFLDAQMARPLLKLPQG
jgi:hypothetical protein